MKSFLLSCFFFGILHLAVPDTDKAKNKTQQPYKTNWGVLTWSGKKIKIEGHPYWNATGEMKANGLIFLEWVLNDNGKVAPGVYFLDDKKDLVGLWGWEGEIQIDEQGKVAGTFYDDVTYKLPPEEK